MGSPMAEPFRACLGCGSIVEYFAVANAKVPGAGWCSAECWTGKSAEDLQQLRSVKSLSVYPPKSLDP